MIKQLVRMRQKPGKRVLRKTESPRAFREYMNLAATERHCDAIAVSVLLLAAVLSPAACIGINSSVDGYLARDGTDIATPSSSQC